MLVFGLFITIATPNFKNVSHKARVLKARAEVTNITTAINLYKMDHNDMLPSNLNKLTQGGSMAYMLAIPKDPWGHNYRFVNGIVSSTGADGAVGGTGYNADIIATNQL